MTTPADLILIIVLTRRAPSRLEISSVSSAKASVPVRGHLQNFLSTQAHPPSFLSEVGPKMCVRVFVFNLILHLEQTLLEMHPEIERSWQVAFKHHPHKNRADLRMAPAAGMLRLHQPLLLVTVKPIINLELQRHKVCSGLR